MRLTISGIEVEIRHIVSIVDFLLDDLIKHPVGLLPIVITEFDTNEVHYWYDDMLSSCNLWAKYILRDSHKPYDVSAVDAFLQPIFQQLAKNDL